MHIKDTTVEYVEPGSYADEAKIEPGDKIISVNGNEFYDILEYRYLISEYEIELEVLKKNGDTEKILIENDYEDIGIEFSNALIDTAQSCRNKCIFCFIDQLPEGMRETCYFKDDDTRLSFLQGNYVTLTNLTDNDIDRLIKMRVSPINISVHTTDPELRVKMLKNRNAGKIMDIMKKFAKNRMYMNAQIVLCRGYNDKKALDKTISDLSGLYPYIQSVSVVPVGLTAFRKGLTELLPFGEKESEEVIVQTEKWQKKLKRELGSNLIYLSDEFYVNAKRPIPDAKEYEGFPQIENGVGLMAAMEEEFSDGLARLTDVKKPRTVSLVTGEMAYGFIEGLTGRLCEKADGLKVNVYAVKNRFFGGGVSVAGLVVGRDIVSEIKGKELGEELFIPDSMLRAGEDVFLDNMTLSELSEKLGVKITPVANDGYEFIEKISGTEIEF